MFAQVKADFADRVLEVNLFFQALASIDNEELSIVRGVGDQVFPVGKPPDDLGRMMKGTGYLVLYNLVEAFVRRGFEAVFDAIKKEGLCGAELSLLLREQWIMQKNKKIRAFDGSPKVYMQIANEIVSEITEKKAAFFSRDRLPFSGNLDAQVIRKVCFDHGVEVITDPGAKGGDVLRLVKIKRNALAHGDESFVECGRELTAADLIKAKDEIVLFMEGVIASLENFAAHKSYRLVAT